MISRYTRNQEIKEAIESLLAKLSSLFADECMAVVRDIQKDYYLSDKLGSSGSSLQRQGGNPMRRNWQAMERFAPDIRRVIVFDVLYSNSPVGWKGERMRLFLTKQGYQKSLDNCKSKMRSNVHTHKIRHTRIRFHRQ